MTGGAQHRKDDRCRLRGSGGQGQYLLAEGERVRCDRLRTIGGRHSCLARGAYGGEAHQGQYLKGVAIYLASRAGDYAV
jgi:hypothetical protein